MRGKGHPLSLQGHRVRVLTYISHDFSHDDSVENGLLQDNRFISNLAIFHWLPWLLEHTRIPPSSKYSSMTYLVGSVQPIQITEVPRLKSWLQLPPPTLASPHWLSGNRAWQGPPIKHRCIWMHHGQRIQWFFRVNITDFFFVYTFTLPDHTCTRYRIFEKLFAMLNQFISWVQRHHMTHHVPKSRSARPTDLDNNVTPSRMSWDLI